MDLIALKMLFNDRAKYLGLVIGVAFSTLLINQQMGIFLGLLSRAGAVAAMIIAIASIVALRRVLFIDPAIVFRG